MNEATWIILLHQALFQGLFMAKNISLKIKLGKPIRGNNAEANRAVGFFILFIALSLYLAATDRGNGIPAFGLITGLSLSLLGLNLLVAIASLRDLGKSWRVGVIEEQETALIEEGIYRYSRNPYFVSYLLLFAAYTLLLKSMLLLVLSCIGFALVHAMIRREEAYLDRVHGQTYLRYKQRVPRYLLL
jgi:protein-S-isoprenylcysteine O-methyltransferase Ste14